MRPSPTQRLPPPVLLLVVETDSSRRRAVVLVRGGHDLRHDESGNERAENQKAFDRDPHRRFSLRAHNAITYPERSDDKTGINPADFGRFAETCLRAVQRRVQKTAAKHTHFSRAALRTTHAEEIGQTNHEITKSGNVQRRFAKLATPQYTEPLVATTCGTHQSFLRTVWLLRMSLAAK